MARERPHDAADADVGPDDGRVRVLRQELAQLGDEVRLLVRFGNGMLTSVWRRATSPASPAKSRMRSSAGSVSVAGPPAIFAETNSLWIENSPIPENTPGKVSSTRRMWSAAYMSAGLKPVIIGSIRACCSGGSDRYDIAIAASVNE